MAEPLCVQRAEETVRRQVTTLGLDLAKTVFQVDGADAKGRVVFKTRLTRGKVLSFFANLPPCLVGMRGASLGV